jgi:hypothetical protein
MGVTRNVLFSLFRFHRTWTKKKNVKTRKGRHHVQREPFSRSSFSPIRTARHQRMLRRLSDCGLYYAESCAYFVTRWKPVIILTREIKSLYAALTHYCPWAPIPDRQNGDQDEMTQTNDAPSLITIVLSKNILGFIWFTVCGRIAGISQELKHF